MFEATKRKDKQKLFGYTLILLTSIFSMYESANELLHSLYNFGQNL